MSASIILALMASAKMKLMAINANVIQAFLDKTVTFLRVIRREPKVECYVLTKVKSPPIV